MIHIVTAANRALYRKAIEDHFRIRHAIFVEERGWRALERPDGREIDQYDTERTTYLLAMEDGRVVGGHRLFPTVEAHMISDIFPHLVELGPIPSAPEIFEWSRFFVVRERRRMMTYLQLMAAVQELCLAEGISQVTAIIEMWWLPRFLEAGFVVKPLGLPKTIEGVATAAVAIDIREESLARVQEMMGSTASVLVRRGNLKPLIERPGHVPTR